MKLFIAIALLLAISCVAALKVRPLKADLVKRQWSSFKETYNKKYTAEEEEKRFSIFQENMVRYEARNRKSGSRSSGVNKFSDLSLAEFRATNLPTKIPKEPLAQSCLSKGVTADIPSLKSQARALPPSWDWTTKGVVSPVKNQGDCGSCWAFSTIGNIESQWALKTKSMVTYSEQLLVDCSQGCSNEPPYGNVCNQGCNGGWQWNALEDIMTWGGVETESDYPYTGQDGSCQLNAKKLHARVANYTCLTNNKTMSVDENIMAAYLVANGPIAIALDADYVEGYSSGIIDPSNGDCQGTSLDHAVLIVGYGMGSSPDPVIPYWKVKNSWGGDWGEQGYFRIVRGEGACGLNTAVLSANLA